MPTKHLPSTYPQAEEINNPTSSQESGRDGQITQQNTKGRVLRERRGSAAGPLPALQERSHQQVTGSLGLSEGRGWGGGGLEGPGRPGRMGPKAARLGKLVALEPGKGRAECSLFGD